MGALSGLKVLDLSRLLPGPYLTLLLADAGADVVKVEEPGRGDYLRHTPPFTPDDRSALFVALNRNKRSVCLDLRSPDGAAALKALVGSYDILVESFRPGVMDRLGLGYAALSALNPRLLYLSLSGYGQTGPLAQRAGHDLGYLARAGALGLGGDPAGLPEVPGVQLADLGGAMLGCIAILAAVIERQSTGVGKHLDVALADAGFAFAQPHLAARLLRGPDAPPLQRGDEMLTGGVPSYQVYRTKDGRALAVAALEPKFWEGLCRALDRPEMAHLPYATGADGARVKAELSGIFATRTQAEWEAFFAPLDLCVEPVREGDEAFADAYLLARGFRREGPDGTELLTPLKLGEVPKRPAPGLGEHTDEVLRAAGVLK
jgi:crotonobetainyl-CoA:carnitine CoA-transferase CaiB-like acyl-CoA transferase